MTGWQIDEMATIVSRRVSDQTAEVIGMTIDEKETDLSPSSHLVSAKSPAAMGDRRWATGYGSIRRGREVVDSEECRGDK